MQILKHFVSIFSLSALSYLQNLVPQLFLLTNVFVYVCFPRCFHNVFLVCQAFVVQVTLITLSAWVIDLQSGTILIAFVIPVCSTSTIQVQVHYVVPVCNCVRHMSVIVSSDLLLLSLSHWYPVSSQHTTQSDDIPL